MMRKLTTVFLLLLLPFTSNAKDWVYVVAPDDNIWNISKRYLKDMEHFPDIQKLNNIPIAKQLQPGDVLRIPLKWVKKHAAQVNVKSFSGESLLIRESKFIPVTTQTSFTLGDELRVAANATITLVFADKTEMTLSDNVLMHFDHLSSYGATGMVDTRVHLQSGKMEIRAAKQLGAGSRLDIKTASAITSVRGTVFRVGTNDSKAQQADASIVEVLEGEVGVSAGAKTVGVKQGFGLKVEKGKELQQPVKLLLSPTFINFKDTIDVPAQQITWQALDLADSYNIQIATDVNFSILNWQTSQTGTSINLPDLPDGDYFIRVSAIAKNGMEGLTTPSEFTINIYPSAPKLTPLAIINIDEPKPLQWQTIEGIQSYLLQIAKDSSFTDVIIDEVVNDANYLIPSPLPLGVYYWRVASVELSTKTAIKTNTQEQGPFSAFERFEYSTTILPPKLNVNSRDKNIEVTWSSLPENQHVELQTAPSSDFDKTKSHILKSNASYKFVLKENEPVYIRAKAVLTEFTISSQWSNYCKVADKLEICNK